MASRFGSARILIVDDSPANVALIDAVLHREGFQHRFTETDSRQVLSRLAEIDPDLVVLDLHMPHLDGIEVLKQIRSQAPSEYLPILILTGDTTTGATRIALTAGAQDFVTKPFNNAEFVLRCESLLATRFLYSSLRGSLVLQVRDHEHLQARLSLAEASEREAARRLEILDQLKNLLLQTVSHDLRSPISAVLVLAAMLAADVDGKHPLPPEAKRSVIATIDESARKMSRLLEDILESDPLRTVVEPASPCDVGEVVQRALIDADLAATHPLDLQLASVMVNIDPVHVERIVANLLVSAGQDFDNGAPLIVSTGSERDGVMISVEDTASTPGSELAERAAVGALDEAVSNGAGLGLSLVSRFTSLHGGRTWSENRSDGSVIFRVFLPSPPVVLG